MKNFLTIIFCFITSFSSAQYITITEIDEAGNVRELHGHRPVIDINSKINIDINQAAITNEIDTLLITDGSKAVDSIIDILKLYRAYIEKMNEAIIQYALLFETPGNSIDLTLLKTALRERGIAGQKIVRLFPEGSRFHRRREEELSMLQPGLGSNENFRIIMRLLAEEMQFAEDDLAQLRQDAGYYFQLAAWYAGNRGIEPLHLEGFDDLPPGEFYRYERNKLYLTEAQKEELENLNAFFENMDRTNVFERIADILPGILAKAIDIEKITIQFENVKSQVNVMVAVARDEKENIMDRISQIENTFNLLFRDVVELKAQYLSGAGTAGAGTNIELLKLFMDDVNTISGRITSINNDIRDLITSVDFEALGQSADALKTQLTKLQKVLATTASDLIDHAREGYQLAVYGRQINTAALELSESILNLSIDHIPATTSIDLNFAGKRDPGDLLVIKAMIWKGSNADPVAVEVKEFPVINALPHVHMSVCYTFAKPNTTDSNFKGGPLVSILYKFKSHSLPYRNFMDAGIGLHAASYDFNNDDTPEFAGGIVGSIFKDYLQFGWGFNFNANNAYWFAGLRIPIPTSPVSLMGSR